MSKTLGILGGMGPMATVTLFKKVISMTRANCDQDHIHQIIDSNTQIPDRTSYILGKGEDPAPYLVESALRLEKMGADFIIMPCNTAHYFYERITQSIGIPLLNMVELTAKFSFDTCGSSAKMDLLATDGTCSSGVYDKYFKLQNMELVKPEPDFQKLIMDFIYGIKKGSDADIDKLINAVQNLRDKGAQTFILGCTELSFAKDEYGLKGNFIDPLSVIAQRSVEYALR